ncbi:MAG: flagellin FliC, partial [Magnetovibrio sp.]|nr:flagellin FliC [Magnetovibrio sp.]
MLGNNSNRLAQSVERIASGIRINRGADDAAGLAISESLRSDIRALRQAVRNGNDGIALINTAEGALNEQSAILIRLRELSAQASTGTVGSTERQTLQLEFSALRNEIDRIANTTEFNGQKLIEGSLASTVSSTEHVLVQIGLDSSSDSQINLNKSIDLSAITSSGLGIEALSITSAATALTTLDSINTAISTIT